MITILSNKLHLFSICFPYYHQDWGGISLLYAPTPQAKGKVERLHQLWQGRLPPLLAVDDIVGIAPANVLLEGLREHRNTQEKHRELDCTPQQAWLQARRQKRNALRPFRRDPWWPLRLERAHHGARG